MPVKKDKNGQRYVEAEAEVPGSPEEVWRAIATGKGISSWFVPTTIDEREGGAAVSSYGPGMDAVAKITKWNPPRSFVAEAEEEGLGKVATEFVVEARGGGMCVVRVVHRWFASTNDWDAQFEGAAYGWAASFFRILRLYLAHFAGQECSAFQLAAIGQAPGPETWRTIKSALRIDHGNGRVTSAPGAPELVGRAQSLEVSDPDLLAARETVPIIVAALEGMEGENPELLVRLERPAPGFAHVFIVPMGGPTMVWIRFYLYGDQGAAAVADAEREWSAWLAERFPQEVSA
ncbi:MAG: SRPBCC domain-containing protein [Phycisphaerales bacterium]|nr:SRPBCC domain-containing protein [Phycisphaerales bacterium]MCI0674227.1 SRPBCC domain-containing protein [Phycisphaerales bacterium]